MFIDATFCEPQKNIDFDDYLLSILCKEPLFRIWEAKRFFVVLGKSSQLSEVNLDNCICDSVSICRRNSGGGIILQGPGCISYTVVLPVSIDPVCKSIKGAFGFVLNAILSQLSCIIELKKGKISIKGISDLCYGIKKFSGNAQRRKSLAFYVHGTILYNFPIELVSRYLYEPKEQPSYRGKRLHSEFLTNLPASREEIIKALTRAFSYIEETSAIV